MSTRSRFRVAVSLSALMLALSPFLAVSADGRGGGGGGGGGGHFGGGGGGFHMGGGGFHMGGGGFGGFRSAPMMHAPMMHAPMMHAPMMHAPMMHGPSVHSLSGLHAIHPIGSQLTTRHLNTSHLATQHLTTSHIATQHVTTSRVANTHVATKTDTTHGNLVTHNVQGTNRTALRNNSFASAHNGPNHGLANTTFPGKFAGQHWKHNGGWWWHNRFPVVIVIGWYGPVFWPWAWWDFVDYTFWPYAYDVFWPYAYDDIYWGLYGPYAYPDPAYVSAPAGVRYASRTTREARVAHATSTGGEVCSDRVPALTDWPIEQITKAVEPDQAHQSALNDLKDATARALDALQGACPTDLPSTPTGRLAAMRARVEAMLQAVGIVQPALERFYNSLTDEQKARFNALAPEAQPARRARTAQVSGRAPDISQVCSAQAARAVEAPTQRIAQALHPTDAQRSALDALDDATMRAADLLKANCPADETLTPPGRVAAMQQRLSTMLEAIKIVQPALENFYGTLTDEQKARFNQLGAERRA